ncbi:MAG: phosphoribosyltransferase [bacterium]|nr:phosphoribosyltransferase [bacterium]
MIEHRYDERLQEDIDALRRRMLNSPESIMDQETEAHHLFANGLHGLKVDCDMVEDNSDLYINMTSVYARAILDVYDYELPDVLIGVANGANRFAASIAPMIGAVALATKKNTTSDVELSEEASETLEGMDDDLFGLVIEDVGTSGSTVWSLVDRLRGIDRFGRIEAFHLLQRSATLHFLDSNDVTYRSVVFEPQTDYSKADCEVSGFCSRDVPLLENGFKR